MLFIFSLSSANVVLPYSMPGTEGSLTQPLRSIPSYQLQVLSHAFMWTGPVGTEASTLTLVSSSSSTTMVSLRVRPRIASLTACCFPSSRISRFDSIPSVMPETALSQQEPSPISSRYWLNLVSSPAESRQLYLLPSANVKMKFITKASFPAFTLSEW